MKVAQFSVWMALAASAGAAVHTAKTPVDYVSPNIGGIGQLLTATSPLVQLPHGMVRLAPVTTPEIKDRYLADKIYGFPAGAGTIMVTTGMPSTIPAENASEFDHDFETATPYFYKVELATSGAAAAYTATAEAAIYRFTIPEADQGHIVLMQGEDAFLKTVGTRAVAGGMRIHGSTGPLSEVSSMARQYIYAEFSQPLASVSTWVGGARGTATEVHGSRIGLAARVSGLVEVRIGVSYISEEQAHRNLDRETKGKSFEALKSANRSAWEKALGQVKVDGGTESQKTIFYTALWRSLGRMTNITEDGKYYSGFDHEVHDAEGHDFYNEDGLWDTFRSMHPLQLLLDGHRQEDMVRSYLRMYQQGGWLPSFPSIAGEQAVMIGHHADQLILDTYAKGFRDFDLSLAYEAMKKNATEATMLPWKRGGLTSLDKVYLEKGFFPSLALGEAETVPEVTHEKRQPVSVTLEVAYDDWTVSEVAKALGKSEDAALFARRAHNYVNLFNAETGFMAPKSADGKWVEKFDPKNGGGQGGREYTTEVDSWLYTFSVQHDPEGLIRLMGGRDAFNKRLDQLFVEQYDTSKFHFLGQFPDATGLVGLYAQGNEPSLHIPYMYDFSGQPWKAQKRLRQLMDVWYTDGPLGISGDDDGGELSSWYVLSAMGFYPECPGSPVYEIGSPIFTRSAITLGNGKVFAVVAEGASAQNKYIQSAILNGAPWSKPWFSHADIAQGGTLKLVMGPKPNVNWGSLPADAPPSMTH
ncbi:alpha-1,2-mannosidase, putative [Granulicella pectinivorans]|uniref:Alpha-1,2-mannosidase, putative n=1 Tax=Granulicella pectinivorans TaxID=474950 RepID=A0A1I6MYX8_9BACT|nr:GH92 family glycosyl hydrolase [Granulicella pectinivorans]SFS20896.1 alpha-1,2-mannosidase, putative [Granulicella pectinivorans]